MIAERTRSQELGGGARRGTVLEWHREMRRLLKMGMGQVDAALSGQVLAHAPLRALVVTVRDVLTERLARTEALVAPVLDEGRRFGPIRALREENTHHLAELEALCEWPEDEDELELALRFEAFARVMLDAVAREERELVAGGSEGSDFCTDDPFGC
jgi:hypothetical protein